MHFHIVAEFDGVFLFFQEPVMDMSGIVINIIPDEPGATPVPVPPARSPTPQLSRAGSAGGGHPRRSLLLSAGSSGSGSLDGVASPWDSGPSSPRPEGMMRQRRPSWLKIRPSIQLIPGTPAATSHDHHTMLVPRFR